MVCSGFQESFFRKVLNRIASLMSYSGEEARYDFEDFEDSAGIVAALPSAGSEHIAEAY
jgi:hypothetical protein